MVVRTYDGGAVELDAGEVWLLHWRDGGQLRLCAADGWNPLVVWGYDDDRKLRSVSAGSRTVYFTCRGHWMLPKEDVWI